MSLPTTAEEAIASRSNFARQLARSYRVLLNYPSSTVEEAVASRSNLARDASDGNTKYKYKNELVFFNVFRPHVFGESYKFGIRCN